MAKYKILQTFDARHETFKEGDVTDFAQWRSNDALFVNSNLPQNGLEAARAAHEKNRLDDIISLVRRGVLEDVDKDEIGKVDASTTTPEMIADAQRLVRVDWELRTVGEQRARKPETLDDVLAGKDVAVRLVLDPGQQPVFGLIARATDDAFAVQVPFEADMRWYAKAGLDIPTRTFTGAGAKDDSTFRKASAAIPSRPAAPQTASDQPA